VSISQTAPPVLRLLYFAWLRERLGTGQEEIGVPAGVATVGELLAWMRGRGPAFEAAFGQTGPRTVRCAVNQDFADAATPVRAGDEIAFFPPVTGG
jgi:molybdopterin synthase sulfur carrier subunit